MEPSKDSLYQSAAIPSTDPLFQNGNYPASLDTPKKTRSSLTGLTDIVLSSIADSEKLNICLNILTRRFSQHLSNDQLSSCRKLYHLLDEVNVRGDTESHAALGSEMTALFASLTKHNAGAFLLSSCPIPSPWQPMLRQQLTEHFKATARDCAALTEVSVSADFLKAILDSVASVPKLKMLNLSHVKLMPGCHESFASALPNCTSLREVKILRTPLNAELLEGLVSGIRAQRDRSRPWKLTLKRCGILDSGASILSTIVASNLSKLDLSYNEIGNAGVRALARSFSSINGPCYLKQWSLKGNPARQDTIQMVTEEFIGSLRRGQQNPPTFPELLRASKSFKDCV